MSSPPVNPRQSKRPRISTRSAYHDRAPISLSTPYSHVFNRSECLVGNGSDIRTSRKEGPVLRGQDPWLHNVSFVPPDNTEFALDPDGALYDKDVERDAMEEDTESSSSEDYPAKTAVKRPVRSKVARRPNIVWREIHRETYLDELCRWEGRGDFQTSVDCPDCVARGKKPESATYRCLECFLPDLVCKMCSVKRHRVLPLHRIQHWTGTIFQQVSLKSMGMRVQLNHPSLRCSNPVASHKSLLIMHINGIHKMDIDFCGCEKAEPQHIQLLRRQFYPATQLTPKTCATFELLQHLHTLALTTKAATYDFYRALEKMTSPLGIGVPVSRYKTLFRVMMQWRHLKLLKRGGRAHDPGGAEATTNGELAILCPSCPRPGINLPDGWDKASAERRFLYMIILCMDANFRLKNQVVSNYSQDPGMGIGWAYMIPRIPYEAYVLERAGEEDISTCVGLQALAKAYTKYCAGLRYTGVSAVSCGRSEMLLPVAVGNLQKGERYCNMDYTFGSSLLSVAAALMILISYDICCQWYINLFARINDHWPAEIKPTAENRTIIPAIPKLHHSMHERKDHEKYNLNFTPGAANTDCECPERIWAPHNILGNATKLQGPGTRHDYLDDHWGYWNWMKYCGMGKSIAAKYKAAVAERNLQIEGHRGLTASIDAALVKRWEEMATLWDSAPFPKTGIENPFESGIEMLTENEVRKQLAEEEESRLEAGGTSVHSTSASMFIILGLDLEDGQRRLQRLVKITTAKSTALKKGGLTEQRNVLKSRIKAWELLLPIYMPGLLQYITTLNASHTSTAAPASTNAKPEIATLWLPSRIPESHRTAVCQEGMASIEERLRTVQCSDALASIRHIMKLKSRMIGFKRQHLTGQRDGTRSRSVIDRVHGRARAAADKYRAAREARKALVGADSEEWTSWTHSFKELSNTDVRGYQDPSKLKPRTGRAGVLEDDVAEAVGRTTREAETLLDDIDLRQEERSRRDGTGETTRTLSWIWTTPNSSSPANVLGADEPDDILRGEWAQSRARAARSSEEVALLKEEMRRVKEFLKWKAAWWRERSSRRVGNISRQLEEALAAYAEGQAQVQVALSDEFGRLWKNPLIVESHIGNEDEEDDNEDEDDDDDDDDEGIFEDVDDD